MAKNNRKKWIVWEFDRKDGKNTTIGVQLRAYTTKEEAEAERARRVAIWGICPDHENCSDRFVVQKGYPIEI